MDMQIERRLAEIAAYFAARGLKAEIVRGERGVAAMMADIGKKTVHPVTKFPVADVVAGKALWFALKRDGKYITCISARLEDFGRDDFTAHWGDVCAQSYPERSGLIKSVSPELQTTLRGRLVYFGGVQVAQGEKGNISRLSRFCDYARCVVCLTWDFDWIYTIINYEHRKLSRVYGFDLVVEGGVFWSVPTPLGLSNDQVFLLSNYQGTIRRLIANPGQERDHSSDVAV